MGDANKRDWLVTHVTPYLRLYLRACESEDYEGSTIIKINSASLNGRCTVDTTGLSYDQIKREIERMSSQINSDPNAKTKLTFVAWKYFQMFCEKLNDNIEAARYTYDSCGSPDHPVHRRNCARIPQEKRDQLLSISAHFNAISAQNHRRKWPSKRKTQRKFRGAKGRRFG